MINIILGDCLDKLKEIDDNSIDLIITSPPYANQRKGWYSSR
jgi:DNA modification methylase